MLNLPLTNQEQAWFTNALRQPGRSIRFSVQAFSKTNKGLPWDLLLVDGEVIMDSTSHDQPSRTAHLDILDVSGKLRGERKMFFDKRMLVRWEIFVPEMLAWVRVPIFFGPVVNITRSGKVWSIDCAGKEREHLPPYDLAWPFTAPKHMRRWNIIHTLLAGRGENQFELEHPPSRNGRTKTYGIGSSPWKVAKGIAAAMGRQLFYRGNGRLRLRTPPRKPAWKFLPGEAVLIDPVSDTRTIDDLTQLVVVRGEKTVKANVTKTTKLTQKAVPADNSIHVDSSDGFKADGMVLIGPPSRTVTKKITSGYAGGTTVTLTSTVGANYAVGAEVRVKTRDKVQQPVFGRARLAARNHLSAESLTGGKRPRVTIVERNNIHKATKAKESAEDILQRTGGHLQQDFSFAALTVPHLEEEDIVRVPVAGTPRNIRVSRMTIPLNKELSQFNWSGSLPHRRKGHHG
jgi:hypothetical protein